MRAHVVQSDLWPDRSNDFLLEWTITERFHFALSSGGPIDMEQRRLAKRDMIDADRKACVIINNPNLKK